MLGHLAIIPRAITLFVVRYHVIHNKLCHPTWAKRWTFQFDLNEVMLQKGGEICRACLLSFQHVAKLSEQGSHGRYFLENDSWNNYLKTVSTFRKLMSKKTISLGEDQKEWRCVTEFFVLRLAPVTHKTALLLFLLIQLPLLHLQNS